MDDNQKLEDGEKGGMTFGEFFRTVWLAKWVALIVAVAVAAVCVISLYFGYNGVQNIYEVAFSMNLPDQKSNTAYVYPDGRQFHYTDMISAETLESIKNSDSAFSDIDVEKMTSGGNISIKRETEEQSGSTSNEFVYTISVRKRCFSSDNQAREFLKKVASVPVDYIAGMNINYGAYLDLAGGADDFDTEISFLKNQMDELRKGYDKLITSYGASFVGEDKSGKTLLAYSQEVKAYTDVENLLTAARGGSGGAPKLKNETDRERYRIELATLTAERDKQQEILDALLTYRSNASGGNADGIVKASVTVYADDNSGTPIIAGEQVVLEQAQLVADLNEKVKNLEKYVNDGVVDGEFTAQVAKAYLKVSELTDAYAKTIANVYSKSAQVSYVQPSVIAVSGGMSILMILLLSVVIGVIVAILAAFIAGKIKLNKSAATVTEAAAQPAAGAEEPAQPDGESDGGKAR